MSDTHALPFLLISPDLLAALDNRAYHFALQPFHHLIRLAHVLSISAFFGAIVMLDLRLAGFGRTLPLKALSGLALPWIYGTFAVAIVTGTMLFFYDPVHVASHAYFSLKLILIAVGLVNAGLFNRRGFGLALASPDTLPRSAKIVGAISLLVWVGVMICASLNVEAEPKVLLR